MSLVIDFVGAKVCGGLGDRLVGLVSAILLARHSGRELFIHWHANNEVWMNLLAFKDSVPNNALVWECIDQRFKYQETLLTSSLQDAWSKEKHGVVVLQCNQEIASFLYQNEKHYPHLRNSFSADAQQAYQLIFTSCFALKMIMLPLRIHRKYVGIQIRAGDVHMNCGHVLYHTNEAIATTCLPHCYQVCRQKQWLPETYDIFLTSDIDCVEMARKVFHDYHVICNTGLSRHCEKQANDTEGMIKMVSDLQMLRHCDVVIISWQSNFGRVGALMNVTQEVYAINSVLEIHGPIRPKELLMRKHLKQNDILDDVPAYIERVAPAIVSQKELLLNKPIELKKFIQLRQ